MNHRNPSRRTGSPLRVVVTGAAGQLGNALARTQPDHFEGVFLGRGEYDVVKPGELDADVVINCAAYTQVDAAEDDEPAAARLNTLAPAQLADACARAHAHLIHVSTDYVFGSDAPRRPLTPQDATHPDTVYGRTKLAGERALSRTLADAHFTVIRTAWLFSGNALPQHRDFVSTMLTLAERGGDVRVVNDQTGSPTYALDLAAALWQVAAQPPGGVRHVVGAGQATWYEVARAVFAAAGHDPARVKPIPTREYPTRARRPAWSVLHSDYPLPDWESGVRRAVQARL